MAPMDMSTPFPSATPPADLPEEAPQEPRVHTSMLTRSALAAAALALAVSGGAYAAVRVADEGSPSASSAALAGQALNGEADTSATGEAVTVEASATTVTTVTEDVTEAHGSVSKETDALPEGETKVETQGVDGVVRTVYQVTTVDGQEVSRSVLSTAVVTQKVDEVILVGTGKAQPTPAPSTASPAPDSGASPDSGAQSGSSDSDSSGSADSGSSGGSGGSSADAGVWAQLAQCESGGNPTTNTGNGYYGLYQFSLSTWQSVGGSGLPSEASAEEQTMRAQMLQQRSGWGQWPHCAAKLGLL